MGATPSPIVTDTGCGSGSGAGTRSLGGLSAPALDDRLVMTWRPVAASPWAVAASVLAPLTADNPTRMATAATARCLRVDSTPVLSVGTIPQVPPRYKTGPSIQNGAGAFVLPLAAHGSSRRLRSLTAQVPITPIRATTMMPTYI
jgi:hypothetical protein